MPSDVNSFIFAIAIVVFGVGLEYLMPGRQLGVIFVSVGVVGMLYATRSLFLPVLIKWYGRFHTAYPWAALIVDLLGVVVAVVLIVWGILWLPREKSLEVIGLTPVDVFSRRRFTIDGQNLEHVDHGISFVLRVRNGDRVSFINGLSLTGKLHLNFNEFIFFATPESEAKHSAMPMVVLEDLMKKSPYVVISWSGWPSDRDSKESVELEPFEEAFIKLTVHRVGEAIPGYYSPLSNYIGYEDGGRAPVWILEFADPEKFFPDIGGITLRQLPADIHNGFRKGTAQIALRMGTQSVAIEPSKIQTIRRVERRDWEKGSAQEIYFGHSYYKSFKDITPYSLPLGR